MITSNYESVNNGVYKSGFARSQNAYEAAVTALFVRLDELDFHLEDREWLVGDGRGTLTEADLCLFTTLVRFDLVYVVHFKCNLQRITDYPHLQTFVERMLALPGIRATCDWTHIKHHYFWSHQHMNPTESYHLAPNRTSLSNGSITRMIGPGGHLQSGPFDGEPSQTPPSRSQS